MTRTVTIVAADTGARADVRLQPADAPLADLRRRLGEIAGVEAPFLARDGVALGERVRVADLRDGDVLVLSSAPLPAGVPPTVEPSYGERAAFVEHSDGTTVVHPAARPMPSTSPARIAFPTAPAPPPRPRLPLLGTLAPLLAGLGLAAVTRRWEFAAFAVMSPLVIVGQAASDRWSARREHRRLREEHLADQGAADRQLDDAIAAETRRRHEAAPDIATLLHAVRGRTTLLWHRSIDGPLRLRVGTGVVPADVHVEGPRPAPMLRDVPVCVALAAGEVVGVAGAGASDIARALVLQVSLLHGPARLAMTVVAPNRGTEWSWLRWLPHLRRRGRVALAVTTASVASLLELPPPTADRHIVVVHGVSDTSVATALVTRPATSVIWVAEQTAQLPGTCTTVVESRDGGAVVLTGAGEVVVATDLVTAAEAEAAARLLAPLREAAVGRAHLPDHVSWAQLHALDLTDRDTTARCIARRWAAGPSTRIRIGVGIAGPVELDLQADGPHALVAGTTGAGKSELLQSLVAGLATQCSPNDLSLLLLDHKGGAAFAGCTRLPHTVAVLTDLDAATTSRALRSLRAELRRRERLLAGAGVPDVESWRRESQDCALGRLVIVVDEFATLADELPEFLDGLVDIARRGRSLGVHLVLATQRPDGAVSADIRANTRLRLCLAVARDIESRDVIDSPDAASIDPSTPGRAFVRVSAGELVAVQVARVAGPYDGDAGRPQAQVVPLTAWATYDDQVAASGPTELDLLIDAVIDAASGLGETKRAAPWLPPLPDQLAVGALPSTPSAMSIGLVDEPHELRQTPLMLPLDDAEPLLIAGGPRSGRTTAALTIAISAGARLRPDELHVWAIDAGAGLASVAELPHTGAVVDVRDLDRVERLLAFLLATVEQRRGPSNPVRPQMLLVVDTWEGLCHAAADADSGRCQELLLRLLTCAAPAGLRIVVTGDRSALSGRLAGAVANTLCLRLADRADYALLGIPPREVPVSLPAGRALRASDHALVQVARAGDRELMQARSWPPSEQPPRSFAPLPARVALRALRRGHDGLVVGMRTDDLQPVVIDPDDMGAFLVAGNPGSGRSTALVSFAVQLQHRRVLSICGSRGPLRDRSDIAQLVDTSDGPAMDEAVAAVAAGAALLVDDVELLDDAAVLEQIDVAVRHARDGSGFVVIAGLTEAMCASFRGPVAQVRRARAGLVLRPEAPSDGELLGVRLRRRVAACDPPGRGLVAVHGRAVTVQVPHPD